MIENRPEEPGLDKGCRGCKAEVPLGNKRTGTSTPRTSKPGSLVVVSGFARRAAERPLGVQTRAVSVALSARRSSLWWAWTGRTHIPFVARPGIEGGVDRLPVWAGLFVGEDADGILVLRGRKLGGGDRWRPVAARAAAWIVPRRSRRG